MIPLVAPSYSPADKLLAQWDTDIQVRKFEEEFAGFVGCRGAVAVNSGTNALIVALRVSGLGVLSTAGIPSYTCRAILDAFYAARLGYELRDNFCDVRRAQFSVREPSTVVTHMFGTAAGVESHIDDITLSLGAVRSPKYGVCSFNRDKMISTGRGGMIVSNEEWFLSQCREVAYYDYENLRYTPAFSFGMTGMQAALGRSQLRQLPGFIERRKEIAARYTAAFSEVGIETPSPDVESVYFRYIVGVDDPASKVRALAARGVEAGRGVNPPLHRLLGLDPSGFPGAEECFGKLLSVPIHPGLTDEQVEKITRDVVGVCSG